MEAYHHCKSKPAIRSAEEVKGKGLRKRNKQISQIKQTGIDSLIHTEFISVVITVRKDFKTTLP